MSKKSLLTGDALNEFAGEDEEEQNWYSTRCRSFVSCLRSFMLPGYGMFSEAFFLFSVGNLKKGIFPVSYPNCWNSNKTLNTNCNHESLKASISYSMLCGVILGMLIISIFGDKFGRRAGSILTSLTMLVGAILMACSYGPTVEGEFLMFAIALAIFGVGVGGEYPLASSSATERALAPETRGKTVLLTFSMQGVGIWVYTCWLIVLLYVLGVGWDTKIGDYHPVILNRVWRYTYGVGAAGLFIAFIGRAVFLEESKVYEKRNKTCDIGAIRHFWHRLFGTAVSWFVWDITFYANKLFQGSFITEIVGGDPTPFQILVFILINSTVSLLGYYAAAYSVDKMGRWTMQFMGFFVLFLVFLICGIMYGPLSKQPVVFMILYLVSSFFGQWGPNATTWLIPAEIFPTEIRATAHGWSAAAGKLGALLAGVLFGLGVFESHPQYAFIISGICGFIGLIVTTVFIPEGGLVSLEELDKYWEMRKEGEGYDGPVVHRKNRSWWETMWNLTSFSETEYYSDE